MHVSWNLHFQWNNSVRTEWDSRYETPTLSIVIWRLLKCIRCQTTPVCCESLVGSYIKQQQRHICAQHHKPNYASHSEVCRSASRDCWSTASMGDEWTFFTNCPKYLQCWWIGIYDVCNVVCVELRSNCCFQNRDTAFVTASYMQNAKQMVKNWKWMRKSPQSTQHFTLSSLLFTTCILHFSFFAYVWGLCLLMYVSYFLFFTLCEHFSWSQSMAFTTQIATKC